VSGGNEAVEEQRRVSRATVPKLGSERLATVGAGRLDPAVGVQRGTDAECVPGAVAVPPAAAGVHAVGRRHDGERIEHPQLVGGGIEDESVLGMQPAPALEDLERVAELLGRGSATMLHEERVGAAAQLEVASLHPGRRYTVPTVDEDLLDRYAELIVGFGANVQPDQVLAVEGPLEAAPLVRRIARGAYERGARYVDVVYYDAYVKRIRIESAPDDSLEWVPPWLGRRMLDLGDLDAARVVLSPFIPPGMLEGLDPERAGRDRLPTVPELYKVVDDRSVAWTVSPFVTEGWARLVFPELEPAAAVEALWRDVSHVCRLDEPDPVAAWERRIDEIWQVSSRLDKLGLDALHFVGPGTDLTVGLLPSSRFAKDGGFSTTRSGIKHVPNLPTEELYTTPDPERTEGVVASTKPLDVGGAIVRGLRVRFEGGRAVEIDADANAEALRRRCATDEGAARLGEVALVDRESRIGRLGRTFFNTLLDENAASHIALGDAYASPIGDPADLPQINESEIHVDFMVGSDDVTVTGVTRGGDELPVLVGGAWQI
jgi:aminopeptidase